MTKLPLKFSLCYILRLVCYIMKYHLFEGIISLGEENRTLIRVQFLKNLSFNLNHFYHKALQENAGQKIRI